MSGRWKERIVAGTPYEQAPAAAQITSYRGVRGLARFWPITALALIVLGALALRIWGVRGGLPYVDHPDEPNPISYVVRMLRTGDLNPHFFQKPTLYVYMLLGVLSVHYRLGLQSGLYGALDQMTVTTHIYTTIPGFFLWGRLLTVALGGLTVAGVYVLGRRVWGTGAGLIGALFLAVSQFHLQHSQYVTTDVASGLFVLLSFIFAVEIARQGGWRAYLLAGLLAGLAASTKYNAGLIVLPIAAAHGLCWGRRSLARGARLAGAAAAALLGFVLGTPYALLSWREFVKGLVGQVAAYNDGSQGDIRGAWNVRGYLNFFWDAGLLAPGCIAVLLGIGLLLWRDAARKPGAPRRDSAQGWAAVAELCGAVSAAAARAIDPFFAELHPAVRAVHAADRRGRRVADCLARRARAALASRWRRWLCWPCCCCHRRRRRWHMHSGWARATRACRCWIGWARMCRPARGSPPS